LTSSYRSPRDRLVFQEVTLLAENQTEVDYEYFSMRKSSWKGPGRVPNLFVCDLPGFFRSIQ
jgi:hypothetical protein